MSVCSVCNKKVANVAMKIVRGASGEWVCKECLKKASISAMKFSSKNITSRQIMAKINGDIEMVDAETGNTETEDNSPGIRCPKCKSNDLQIISDVKGKGVSATKLCLCGMFGLCGSGKTTTKHYWVCKRCGNKFKV